MNKRTTQGLRDALFDELDELRSGKGDPSKAQAVAQLAKQIMNTARVEMDFVRTIAVSEANGTPMGLGHLQLGSIEPNHVSSVKPHVTEVTSLAKRKAQRASGR